MQRVGCPDYFKIQKVQKYKIQKYKSTKYRNTEVQNTKILQIAFSGVSPLCSEWVVQTIANKKYKIQNKKIQKYKIQKYRSTKYKNTADCIFGSVPAMQRVGCADYCK